MSPSHARSEGGVLCVVAGLQSVAYLENRQGGKKTQEGANRYLKGAVERALQVPKASFVYLFLGPPSMNDIVDRF